MNWKKTIEVLIWGIGILIIFNFWMFKSGANLFLNRGNFFIGMGRLAGLLGVYFVLMQLILIGRVLWVERLFGLDKLAKVHKINGYFALSFMIIHPILLSIGYGIVNNINFFSQLVNFVLYFENVYMAAIALALFIIIVFISINIVRRKLKYELWYSVHVFTYAAILLAFSHQLANGGDFVNNPGFAAYWYFLYAFVLVNFVLFRFLRPLFISTRHSFLVKEIIKENNNVNSVYIDGKEINRFKIKAGQFMILRFLNKELWWQSHPFSLSLKPNEKYLRVSIKKEGDYTSKIPSIKKGTSVIIDGPYGTFTEERASSDKIALIASGIGITPIYSLFESIAGRKDLILLYGGKSKEDLIFKKNIDSIAKKFKIEVHYFLSQEKVKGFGFGRIDKEQIKKLICDYKERDFFICGPGAMLMDIKDGLMSIGVEKKKIHYEKFSL